MTSTQEQNISKPKPDQLQQEIDPTAKMRAINVDVWFGKKQVLKSVNLTVKPNTVTAIIGPSGCGKSTFLRCFNRMHELAPNAKMAGQILLDGKDIYERQIDPVQIRRRVGMVFQKPNPFPTMSIYDNVAAGLKLTGTKKSKLLDEIVRHSLEQATLWDEVKDDLKKSGTSISGGQQQRLCIARAIALQPEVILMDEPCSALDPIATAKIEKLVIELKQEYAVVIVTHNMQQASRISDYTAFMYLGELIEFGETRQIFEKPKNKLTEKYITGEFG
ncbi:MAG: phosphate ABC transporter ATP-binding protein PstB [Nitrososphaerota archaeon]|jgi:phosphate transport system ATP-binding protein|nr:phosphate ABC transporter ATP-binding protein PstB [Nitrososphaerota archaeon]